MFNGGLNLDNLFAGRTSRRRVLQQATLFGVSAAIAACGRSNQQASQSTGIREVKFTHGLGLCNMPLFYSIETDLFKERGVKGRLSMTIGAGDSAVQLAAGQVEMAVTPYTNALAAYTNSPSFQVVAGSGVQGLMLVSSPEVKTIADLKGKKLGTAQADTLEIMAFDYLKANNLTYNDVEVVYFGDSFETTAAMINGDIAACTLIEPYSTSVLNQINGNRLGDGIDLYGQGYPDCVLAARKDFIEREPEIVKNVIKTFFEAQYKIESDFSKAAEATIGKYYKTEMDNLLAAAQAQPPGVDIRDKRDFMFERSDSMLALNYISKAPDDDFVNFSLLDEVIDENPELWDRVKMKSVSA